MRIATLRPHPTDPNFAILAVAADTNTLIGRFEPARLSVQHKGYLVHADDLDALGRFLRIHNIAVADERSRPTATPDKYSRQPFAVLKCGTCSYTQRDCDEDCYRCRQCHNCGDTDLRAHVISPAEQADINARGMAKVAAARAAQPTPPEETP